jgi:CheY-like chemotaxis protein
MSYSRLIQPLIIEDESTTYYDTVFGTLSENGELAPAIHAYSYEDANTILQSNTIVHLVILDLRLPDTRGRPAQQGLDHGLELLQRFADRNKYPIPTLLVISGHIGQANQQDLDLRVRNGFHYGRVLVKGPQLEGDLLAGVKATQEYCDVGIHIRDGADRTYPTVSPREEDLLRRCVLNQKNCTGLDLEWWSAEYQRPTGPYADFMGWKKTLTGQFLLRGDRPSRSTFFKLLPARGADSVFAVAENMEHKLEHIKVIDSVIAGDRSVLVTQKVGAGNDRPISLGEYLIRPAVVVLGRLPHVVEEVAIQVNALGDSTPHRCPTNSLLWADHDTRRIEEQWRLHGGDELLGELGITDDPFALFQELSHNEMEIISVRQSFLHGDLNITNIAMDAGTDEVSAYVFDAEGSTAGVNVRDFAMLEVSTLLHQTLQGSQSLVKHCAPLYRQANSGDLDFNKGSDLARNTLKLISEIRLQALQRAEPYVYALMVFDNALMQLGGLAFGSSCNKICNPRDAAFLAALAACWFNRIALNAHSENAVSSFNEAASL